MCMFPVLKYFILLIIYESFQLISMEWEEILIVVKQYLFEYSIMFKEINYQKALLSSFQGLEEDGCQLSCVVRLILELVRLSVSMSDQHFALLSATISPIVHTSMDQVQCFMFEDHQF